MRGIKFSRAAIAALRPPQDKAEVFVWSSELPAFGVRITRNGHKSWVVQYRLDGKTRRPTLGDVRVVAHSTAEARARQILAAARQGRDLLGEEKEAGRAKQAAVEKTIGALVERYLAEPAIKARRRYRETERYLRRVLVDLHGLDGETVSRHEITAVIRRIAHERGETSANRARSQLSALCSFAILHGWLTREQSPTTFTPRFTEKSRDRVLSIDELATIWRAAPEVDPRLGAILRLLVLTGCRRSEIAELTWEEIDLNKGELLLPGSRTKNGRAHIVPLVPAAVEALERTRLTEAGPVFVPPLRDWARAKARLDRAVQLEPWTIHDIRRSAVTHWVELGIADSGLAELLVNHVSGSRAGVAGVYNRAERLPERRRALEKWSQIVLQAAGEAIEPARVIPLRS